MLIRDLATLNEEGYGSIVGRKKDLIIRGGENIYPAEIEQFLYKHPKIADVQVNSRCFVFFFSAFDFFCIFIQFLKHPS